MHMNIRCQDGTVVETTEIIFCKGPSRAVVCLMKPYKGRELTDLLLHIKGDVPREAFDAFPESPWCNWYPRKANTLRSLSLGFPGPAAAHEAGEALAAIQAALPDFALMIPMTSEEGAQSLVFPAGWMPAIEIVGPRDPLGPNQIPRFRWFESASTKA